MDEIAAHLWGNSETIHKRIDRKSLPAPWVVRRNARLLPPAMRSPRERRRPSISKRCIACTKLAQREARLISAPKTPTPSAATFALSAGFPQILETSHAFGQDLHSSSSVAANYRPACRGNSKTDIISRPGTLEEETHETGFWQKMLQDIAELRNLKIDIQTSKNWRYCSRKRIKPRQSSWVHARQQGGTMTESFEIQRSVFAQSRQRAPPTSSECSTSSTISRQGEPALPEAWPPSSSPTSA